MQLYVFLPWLKSGKNLPKVQGYSKGKKTKEEIV